jgi:hypothetical protein
MKRAIVAEQNFHEANLVSDSIGKAKQLIPRQTLRYIDFDLYYLSI